MHTSKSARRFSTCDFIPCFASMAATQRSLAWPDRGSDPDLGVGSPAQEFSMHHLELVKVRLETCKDAAEAVSEFLQRELAVPPYMSWRIT